MGADSCSQKKKSWNQEIIKKKKRCLAEEWNETKGHFSLFGLILAGKLQWNVDVAQVLILF